MKKTWVILAVIAGLILFAGTILFIFSRGIYQNRSCESCNIDHIEMRCEIDIPKLCKTSECTYNEETEIKLSKFYIDTDMVNIDEYIKSQHLQNITNLPDYNILESTNLPRNFLFGRIQEEEDYSYEILLNRAEGILYIAIYYLQ